jgi:HK97 gp10 family phage protein
MVAYELGVSFDVDHFMGRIMSVVQASVAEMTSAGVHEAKRHAPVRKIFDTQKLGHFTGTASRRTITPLSASDIKAEASVRKRLGLGPTTPGRVSNRPVSTTLMNMVSLKEQFPRRFKQVERPDGRTVTVPRSNATRKSRELLNMSKLNLRLIERQNRLSDLGESLLTSRGRYEVRNAAKRGSLVGTSHGGASRQRVGGRLRREIHADPHASWNGLRYSSAIVSPTPYAKYVEFGTHRTPAQPFMRPAANYVRANFSKNLRQGFKQLGGRSIKGVNASRQAKGII